MSTDTKAPTIYDPGAEGWADEPKVTRSEHALYGELAGAVRLLGTAATATSDAYSLICKHRREEEGECFTDTAFAELEARYSAPLQTAWDLYRQAEVAHQGIASAALTARAEVSQKHGLLVDVEADRKIAEAGQTA